MRWAAGVQTKVLGHDSRRRDLGREGRRTNFGGQAKNKVRKLKTKKCVLGVAELAGPDFCFVG